MKNAKISNAVINRLPRYRRYLIELEKKGVEKISSKDFSSLIGYTASQIRQDLNNFGGFGQQGYGYNVEELFDEVGGILGLDKEYTVVMVGFGNLGQAVSNYLQNKEGFELCGIFDVNPALIGSERCGLTVSAATELEEYLKGNEVDIRLLATDKGSAQSVADMLSKAGVKGIWNFAPLDLVVPESVMLENVHLSDSLYTLAYYISEHEK